MHGDGLFAKTDIKKGVRIIEYEGDIVSKKEGDRRSEEQIEKSKKTGGGAVYVFELDRTHDLDGSVPYNTARFINHSCDPNSKYKIEKGHIWIISTKNIQKGEEITYDYGYDLEDYEDHMCRCNSKSCLGYIVGKEYRNKLG